MKIIDTRETVRPGIIDPTTSSEPTVDQSTAQTRAEYFSYVLTRPQEELEADILNGYQEKLRAEANFQSVVAGEATVSQRIEAAALTGEDPAAVLEEVRGLRFGDWAAPEVSVALERSELGARERRQIDRIVAANNIIMDLTADEGSGFWHGAGEFGDLAVSGLMHNVLGGLGNLVGTGEESFEEGSKLRELAKEAAQLIQTDLPADEFNMQFREILTRVQDAGMFTESNSFYLDTFLAMVEEQGQGKQSQAEVAFQVLDVATLGIGTAITKGIRRAGALPQTISKIHGKDAALSTAVRQADKGNKQVLAELQPSLSHAANPNDEIWMAAPNMEALRHVEATDTALQRVMRDGPAFVDPKMMDAAVASMKSNIRERLSNYRSREIDIRIGTSGFRNTVGQMVMGTAKRTPFATEDAAKKLAKEVGGYVVPTVEEGAKKFLVVKEVNLATEGIGRATSLSKIGQAFGLDRFLSAAHTTTDYLRGVKVTGEAAASRTLKDQGKLWQKTASTVSKQERADVDRLLTRILNDPNEAADGWISRGEFVKRWHDMTEEMPREEVVRYWEETQRLGDIDYFLTADELLYKAVENGETMVRGADGNFYRARRTTFERGTKIWDDSKKDFVYLDKQRLGYEIKDAAYEVAGRGYINKMVVDNPVTRRMYHTDVLAYQGIGHRVYKRDYKWFLKQDTVVKLADGTTGQASPRTLMGLRLETEADVAANQINKIMANLDDPNIEAIIKANNDWNPDIATKADFMKLVEDYSIDVNVPFSKAADGEPTWSSGSKAAAWAGEETIGSRFAGSANKAAKGRGSRPLMGFGGGDADIMDPTRALQMRFARTINKKADAAYVNRAAQGLFRTIEKLEKQNKNPVINWSQIQGLPAADRIHLMEIKSGKIGDLLRTEQETILRSLDSKSADQMFLERKLGAAADYVYGKNIPWIGDKANALAKDATDWLAARDYPGLMRSTAFHSKLGMLSLDQLIVQSSQAINAAAISSATIGSARAIAIGATAGPWMGRAMLTKNADTLAQIARQQAKTTGISPEDFLELREWLTRTGRLVVDRTAVEENRDAVLGAGVKARISNVSTTFFTLGEQNARVVAALLNMAELRAKGFKGSILNNEALTNKMMGRQDVLTASMTRASAAKWQKGIASVPFQFMTYNRNILEQVFSPNILSKQERIRLASAHLLFYGAAAVPGAGYIMDNYGAEVLPPEARLSEAIRYGALDQGLTLLTEALGGRETALSSRLGIGDGMVTLAQDIGGEKSFVELLYGPGGGIIIDSVSAFANLFGSIAKGEPLDVTGYEVNRLGRIVSSYDDWFKLWAAHTYGEYWTRRSGLTTMSGLTTVDGLVQLFGIPLADEKKLWAEIGRGEKRREAYKIIFNEVQERGRLASRLYDENDLERAAVILQDAFFLIGGLPYSERQEAIRRLNQGGDLVDSVVKRLIRDGQHDIARRLAEDQK